MQTYPDAIVVAFISKKEKLGIFVKGTTETLPGSIIITLRH